MISDKLKNCHLYLGMDERLKEAFEFLINTDLYSLKPGKYLIRGMEIYASVSHYATKPLCDARYEAHRKYIDIQYIISGVEKMFCSDIDLMKENTTYDEDKDICFYEGGTSVEMTMLAGTFALFMPHDVHMPSVMSGDAPEPVRKIVIKVRAWHNP